jgi:hypothetical protein
MVVPRAAAATAAMLVAFTLAGCGGSPPAPTPAPVATQAPAAALPTPDPTEASPADIENAFLSNVDDLIAEAADLAVSPCADLTDFTRQNPTLVPSIRGFAAAMQRIGATEPVLNTSAVKDALADLAHSIGELEGALSTCGIKQP